MYIKKQKYKNRLRCVNMLYTTKFMPGMNADNDGGIKNVLI